jgi:four helix bundle protein
MRSIIYEKSFRFSLRIVKLYQYLQKSKRETVMSKQLLRCGTSIGANVAEAQHAQSRADFCSKLNIALKETGETLYWLRLLHATDYLTEEAFRSLYNDCSELEKLLVSIIRTLQQKK